VSDNIYKALVAAAKAAPGIIDRLFPGSDIAVKAIDARIEKIKQMNLPIDEETALILKAPRDVKWLKNQLEIAQKIAEIAKPGTDFSNPKVDDDFVDRFMEEAKHVSDEGVQTMWAGVLAGEFEKPNSTPPSIIRILVEMRKEFAEVFENICKMSSLIFVDDGKEFPKKEKIRVIFLVWNLEFLKRQNISIYTLDELETLGLIKVNNPYGYGMRDWKYNVSHLIYGKKVFTIKNTNLKALHTGNVKFTEAGECLARYAKDEPIDGYIEYLKENWDGVTFEEEVTARAKFDDDGEIVGLIRI